MNTIVHIIDEDGIIRGSMLASALEEGTIVNFPDPAELAAKAATEALQSAKQQALADICLHGVRWIRQ